MYYGISLDGTILPALNEISLQQSKPTQQTKEKCLRLMDYLETYPDAYIQYHASDMELHIDTDAEYLVLPKARSIITGFYHLTNTPQTSDRFLRNGAIFVE